MSGILFYAVVFACLAVLGVLALGLMSFARGGEVNRRVSNKLMRLRVAAQFVAVVLIVLLALVLKEG